MQRLLILARRALDGVHLLDNTATNEQKLQKRLLDLAHQKKLTGLKFPKPSLSVCKEPTI